MKIKVLFLDSSREVFIPTGWKYEGVNTVRNDYGTSHYVVISKKDDCLCTGQCRC